MQPYIIAIEGNIGSGKTTLLNLIEKSEELKEFVTVKYEPVNKWVTVGALETFYRDKQACAAFFQHYVINSILMDQLIAIKKCRTPILIMERSIFSVFHVFMEMGLFDNKIHDFLINEINDALKHDFGKIDSFIFLNTSVDVCFERIKIRNRDGEDAINIEYLQRLETLHKNFAEKYENKISISSNDDLDFFLSFIKNKEYLERYFYNFFNFFPTARAIF